ncbi:hypothetical protein JJB75_15685 [Clostridium perfringens]|uniref:hypothetical protein n=1 Tax=Clostridium perfringens TaxID=1502 RepID=UPI001ABBBF18|nr:hypothetical protein [Clostridium perfringens]MBO3304506.1 hypothetical protein [Clostridium perfringens]MBO3307828.1 hypothetical protein [Clostridium perfringens]MBO3311155.1 hypothetical protein [Clostridium perfringens]MBO3317522.1 hypothetical protein [Clostridium perfringens]
MNKLIGIFSILMGILSNLYTFYLDGDILTLIILISLLGIILSIIGLIKFKEKVFNIIGLILNIIPIIYLLSIFIGLG